MLGFNVDQTKALFFDRAKVVAALDRAKRKVYSMAGSFVRRTAKGLIRKGRKPSKPGSPPKSHTDKLKKFIFFAMSPSGEGVLIGPSKLNGNKSNAKPVNATVPQVLEEGGDIVLGGKKPRKVHVEERPFMGPAQQKNESKFPGLWADSVK